MKKIGSLLALIVAVSLTASCTAGSSDKRHDRGSDDEDDEVVWTTEQSVPESTESSEISEVSEPVPVQDSYGPGDYDVIMSFIDQIHEQYPDAEYAFESAYDQDEEHWYWIVVVSYSDGSFDFFRNIDGNMTPENSILEFWGDSYTYDQIRNVPLIYNYSYDGIEYADSVDDGVYFGSIVAVDSDLSEAIVCIGEPITRTVEELSGYEVGDTIRIDEIDYDFVVAEIDDGFIGSEDGEPYFSYSYTSAIGEDDVMMLTEYSDNPCYCNQRYVVVPISPTCEVTDVFSMLSGTDEADPTLDNGTTLSRSYYWTYMNSDLDMLSYLRETDLANNGYRLVYGLLYPVKIVNGQISNMNIEWR